MRSWQEFLGLRASPALAADGIRNRAIQGPKEEEAWVLFLSLAPRPQAQPTLPDSSSLQGEALKAHSENDPGQTLQELSLKKQPVFTVRPQDLQGDQGREGEEGMRSFYSIDLHI